MKRTLWIGMAIWLACSVNSTWAVDIEGFLSQGRQYEQQQQWTEAFSMYSEALKYEPNNATVHYLLGRVNERLGSIESAVKSYQEAIRLSPGMPEAQQALEAYYLNRGIGFRRNNQSDEALRAFQQVLTFNPNSIAAHFELGQEFEQRKQLAEAAKAYQDTVALDADHSAAHSRLANVYSTEGRYDDAVKEFQEVLRLNERDAEAYHGLGVAYSQLGQKEQAIATLKQAIRFYLIAGHRDKAKPAYALQKKLEAEQFATQPGGKK
ncbi:MAG: tetratricopeptide repeat protein [Candidatus Binatia bacterium]